MSAELPTPSAPVGRYDFTVNGSRGARVGGLALMVAFTVVFLVVAGVIYSGARQVGSADGSFGSTGGGSDPGGDGFRWVIGLFAVVFVGAIAAMLASTVAGARRAAWLDGSVLTVRGLGDASVDLATAQRVWIGTRRVSTGSTTVGTSIDGAPVPRSTGYRTVPRVNVSDGAAKVTLPMLAARGSQLPDADLAVLAAALDRSPADGAAVTADWLRAIAADPGRYFR